MLMLLLAVACRLKAAAPCETLNLAAKNYRSLAMISKSAAS
jgi:hypothetical protein